MHGVLLVGTDGEDGGSESGSATHRGMEKIAENRTNVMFVPP